MTWRAGLLAAALALTACAPAPSAPSPPSSSTAVHEVTVTRVVDGDTVVVTAPSGAETKVRVLAIDTPETVAPARPVECGGPEASKFATDTLLYQIVELIPDPTQDPVDRWGRALAYVELRSGPSAGQDYSVMAAANGMARSYVYDKTYPPQRIDEIRAAERRAVSQRLGLWGHCLDGPTR